MEGKIKHILFLSSWYPTKRRPFLGNFIQRQAKLLSKQYKVTVLHLSSDNNLKNFETEISEDGNFKEVIIYHPKGRNAFSKYYFLKRAFKKGLETIHSVDLIQGNVLFPKGIQFSWAKKHFKCPLIVMEHSSTFHLEKGEKLSLKDNYTFKSVSPHIDSLVSVSDVLKEELRPFFKSLPIDILPNHINTEIFKPIEKQKDETVQFLHISTLDENFKNPKGMIDACKLLIDSGILNFHFTIICDESTKKWKDYRDLLKLSEYISFKGPFNWDIIPSFYQKADCFILFSNYETFSIVLAEAWSCGVPTITTEVGIANNLPKEIGILIQKNNTEDLANAMSEFISSKITFDTKTIQAYAKKFSEKEVLLKYDSIIKEL